MKILKHLIAFAFILGMSSMAGAAPQPPPVNQNLGIPDSNFENFPVNLCVTCHHAYKEEDPNAIIGERPRNNAPVKPGYNPDRHHTVMDKQRYPEKNIIDGMPDFPPFRDADGDGVADTNYTCYNCHKILTDIETGETELDAVILPNFRNCLNCHKRERDSRATVHHATELAQTGFCFRCHGGLVRGIDVDALEGKKPDSTSSDPMATVPVKIPTYQPSIITPWRSNKPNGDDTTVSTANAEPGNCNFCHNSIDGNDEFGTPEPITLNDGSTIMVNIFTNKENHHNTGFFTENKCAWCHLLEFGQEGIQQDGYAIRICQRCHDRSSLHNIEFDAVGDGTQPGAEEPYFGHIGNFKNCWGCHGNNNTVIGENGELLDPATLEVIISQSTDNSQLMSAKNSISTAIIPTLTSLNELSVQEGSEVLMTATGNNFENTSTINVVDPDTNQVVTIDKLWTSKIIIQDKNNNMITIEPITISNTTLEFTLPATLPAGSYDVMIKKAGNFTNALKLVIKPSIKVMQSFVFTPYGGLAVIAGYDFTDASASLVNIGAGLSIVNQDGEKPVRVYIWNDELIVAHFQDIPTSVTITNMSDEKTVPLTIY